jgi:hypothetical protein
VWHRPPLPEKPDELPLVIVFVGPHGHPAVGQALQPGHGRLPLRSAAGLSQGRGGH